MQKVPKNLNKPKNKMKKEKPGMTPYPTKGGYQDMGIYDSQ